MIPMRVAIEGGEIVVRVPVATLPVVADGADGRHGFAEDLVRELNRGGPRGMTAVARMIGDAVWRTVGRARRAVPHSGEAP